MVIYTDGAYSQRFNHGGYGVVAYLRKRPVFAYRHEATDSTNNRMEMEAILYAVRNFGAKEGDFFVPIIYTDSKYAMKSFTEWLPMWKDRGWQKINDDDLKNLDLIQEYDRLVNEEGRKVEIRYVHGHGDNEGNNLADALATGRMTPEEVVKGEHDEG